MLTKNKLIEDNINLVYFVVSHDYPTFRYDDDIVQAGMLGLCKAAEAWDGKRKFSTYAVKCIRTEIINEFRARKPHAKVVSLDTPITEDISLGDTIIGEDDVAYHDDKEFYNQLSADEQKILDLKRCGYSSEEIAVKCKRSVSSIRKILRFINLKWRAMIADQD